MVNVLRWGSIRDSRISHRCPIYAGLIRAFIDAQLDRLRALGYAVESCLVDSGETAEAVLSRSVRERAFDCVLIGAGIRAPDQLLLFERLLNVIHSGLPKARICFNTNPGDSAEAVQRWVHPKQGRLGI